MALPMLRRSRNNSRWAAHSRLETPHEPGRPCGSPAPLPPTPPVMYMRRDVMFCQIRCSASSNAGSPVSKTGPPRRSRDTWRRRHARPPGSLRGAARDPAFGRFLRSRARRHPARSRGCRSGSRQFQVFPFARNTVQVDQAHVGGGIPGEVHQSRRPRLKLQIEEVGHAPCNGQEVGLAGLA